jgi:hypothetical protein
VSSNNDQDRGQRRAGRRREHGGHPHQRERAGIDGLGAEQLDRDDA